MLFTTVPLPIIDHPADAYHKASYGRISYEFIVLHHTGGSNSLDWLSTTSPRDEPVSVHRLISRTGINYKIVPDEEIAFTQGFAFLGGNGYWHTLNERSLSIEFENLGNAQPYPMTQLRMGARQVVEWIGAHGWMSILTHYMIDPDKKDPAFFPRAIFDGLIRDELWNTLSRQKQ